MSAYDPKFRGTQRAFVLQSQLLQEAPTYHVLGTHKHIPGTHKYKEKEHKQLGQEAFARLTKARSGENDKGHRPAENADVDRHRRHEVIHAGNQLEHHTNMQNLHRHARGTTWGSPEHQAAKERIAAEEKDWADHQKADDGRGEKTPYKNSVKGGEKPGYYHIESD